MRCYFWGSNNCAERRRRGSGVISFAIPDWGVQFRARQAGTALECEYAALVALLRFVETNRKIFESKRLEFCTDAAALVHEIDGHPPAGRGMVKVLETVRAIREHVPFELSWIPAEQNAAIRGVLDLAPLVMGSPLHFTGLGNRPQPDKPRPHTPRA